MNVFQSITILAILQLGLIACATPEPLPKSFQNHFKLTVNWDNNPTASAPSELTSLYGYRGWSRVGMGVCQINAPKPISEADTSALETLGHELLHCTDGNYHD